MGMVNKERSAKNLFCNDPALHDGSVDTVEGQTRYALKLKKLCPYGGCTMTANEGRVCASVAPIFPRAHQLPIAHTSCTFIIYIYIYIYVYVNVNVNIYFADMFSLPATTRFDAVGDE